jgi:hypothetical protein
MVSKTTKEQGFKDYKSYNGNPNLKRAGVEMEWTPELVAEWMKCAEDPVYFIETYMKIINVDEGLVSFKLRDYQKEMLDAMINERYTIIGTARQAGKSTTTCGFILHYIIFNQEKTVALLANKGDTAREILGKVQLAYQHLPKWLQHGVEEWNKGSFVLENGSRVIATATSSDNIRGFSINLLFIDEAAHIENWDEFFASVFPTISSGTSTKVVLVSTPKGLNHFYKIWKDSEEGRNSYKRVLVTWKRIPGRDEQWRLDTLAAMAFDADKFAQEHEVEFLGSSGTLIAGWKLKELVHSTPIHEKEGLRQYKTGVKDHVYALCADVSEGKGLDYSAFLVIDVTAMPYEQVCTYRSNNVTPTDYAQVIYRAAKMYNDAHVLIEVNIALGPDVARYLHGDLEYENVMFTASAGARGKKITSGFGANVDMGLRTTKTTKANGCSMLKLLIEQNQLIIHDFHTISELSTFSKDTKQSYSAEPGCHDDLVMSGVLFSWLSNQEYFRELTDVHTMQKLRDKTDEEQNDQMLPFGFIDDHTDDVPVYDLPPDITHAHPDAWMFRI